MGPLSIRKYGVFKSLKYNPDMTLKEKILHKLVNYTISHENAFIPAYSSWCSLRTFKCLYVFASVVPSHTFPPGKFLFFLKNSAHILYLLQKLFLGWWCLRGMNHSILKNTKEQTTLSKNLLLSPSLPAVHCSLQPLSPTVIGTCGETICHSAYEGPL